MAPKPPINFVDLDSLLHRSKNRIHRIGIELEGGWIKVPDGAMVVRDGSVHFDPIVLPAEEEAKYQELHRAVSNFGTSKEATMEYQKLHRKRHALQPQAIGEIPSMPLLCDSKREKDEPLYWEKWLRKYFPSHFNATCGLHVHMGLRSALTYQQLMREDYQATVIEYLGRWAKKEGLAPENPLWARLAGKSEYCQHRFYANEQARQTSKDYDKKRVGHRYTFIHYPFTRNGTIECRGLPMFDLEQSRRAISELLAITNAFLVATARKEETFKAVLKAEDDHFREEMETCV